MKKDIFLTFDMDWASDEVLNDFCNLIEDNKLKATVLVTHDTPVLMRMRKSVNFELGIHPNFNRLLCGDVSDVDIDSVIENIKKIVPESVCIRSHALTQSSIIAQRYEKHRLKYDLNVLIPAYEGLKITNYHTPAVVAKKYGGGYIPCRLFLKMMFI